MAKTAQLVVLVPQSVKDRISTIAAEADVSAAVVVRLALDHGLRFAARDLRRKRR